MCRQVPNVYVRYPFLASECKIGRVNDPLIRKVAFGSDFSLHTGNVGSDFAERCNFNRKFPISEELKSHRSAKSPTPHRLCKHPLCQCVLKNKKKFVPSMQKLNLKLYSENGRVNGLILNLRVQFRIKLVHFVKLKKLHYNKYTSLMRY
jgi:hypothetical protein